MKLGSLFQAASMTGVAAFLMAAGASATTITYNTNAAGTGFVGSGLTLNNSSGVAATLTFMPDANLTVGTPSNINYGTFTLACPKCSTVDIGTGAFFDAFVFDLIITDLTDGATGEFVGTSSGGIVFSDASPISLNWAPFQIGPGTSQALSGNFGTTFFTNTVFTGIVAPNSGAVPGQTTVQGFVGSLAVPEPATPDLIGGGLFGFLLLRRKESHAL